MRKFLSILLAVMMVLSTVSFAAPSAIGSVQTADEYVAVENTPAEEAELEAELAAAADTSAYGKVIYDINFDNSAVGTSLSYAGIKNLGTYTTDYPAVAAMTFGPLNGSTVNEDGTLNWKPTSGTSSNLYYHNGSAYTNPVGVAGVYTFCVDITYNAAAEATPFTNFKVRFATPAQGVLKDFDTDASTLADGKHLVFTYEDTGANLAMIQLFTLGGSGSHTATLDNVQLYYKPSTANVTLNYNGAEFVATGVSTKGVKVSEIIAAANPAMGIMMADGITDGTTTYALTDTVVLGGDSEFDIVAVADPSKDIEKGYTLFATTLDGVVAKDLTGTSGRDWVATLGGTESDLLENGNITVTYSYSSSLATTEDGTLKMGGIASYNQINIYGNDIGYMYQMAPAGIYEFSVDAKFSDGAVPSQSFVRWCESNNNGTRVNGSNYYQKAITSFKDGWQTLTWTINTKTNVTPWTNGLGCVELYTQLSSAGTIEYDNFKLTYKPYTVDVTLDVDGEKYLVEDVTTAGFDVAALANQAGIIAPAGKVAVGSLTDGGETKSSFTLAFDSTIYVTFIDDPTFNKKYGNTLALVDFEKYTVGDVSINGAVKDYASIHNDADGKIILTTSTSMTNKSIIVEDNGGKAISTGTSNGGYAQFRFQMSDYATRPDGYYTMVADTKPNASASVSAKVQDGAYADKAPIYTENIGTIPANAWTKVVTVYDGAYNDYTIYYNNASAPVAYDNVALYYKPKTVTVAVKTTEAGVANSTLTGVSTLGVTVANLVAGVDLGKTNKNLAGINFDGDFYALDKTVIFAANSEVELVFGTSELFDAEKGTALALADFDDAEVGATGWYSDFVDVYKGTENTLDGGDLQFVTSASRQVTADGTFKFAGAATNNQVNLYGLTGANYYQIAPAAGVYEFNLDVKLSNGAALGDDGIFVRWCESDNAGNGNQSNNYHQTGYKSLGDGWNTLKWTIDTTKDVTPWTNGLGILQIFVQLGTAGDVEFDNLKLYYKPATVEVTVVDEDDNVLGTADVSTNGVTAKEIADLVDSGNPFEAVTGITYGDTTYTGSDVLYLTRNATLVATFGKNAYLDQVKGDLVVDMYFDDATASLSEFNTNAATTFGYANPNYPKVTGVTLQLPKETGTTLETDEDGNKYLATVLDAQYNNYNYYWHTGAAGYDPIWAGEGVYTIEMDVRVEGTCADAEKPVQAGLLYYGGNQKSKYVAIDDSTDEWMHVEYTLLYTAENSAGNQSFFYNMLVNNSADYNNVVGHFDNMRVWFKPATAAITGTLDGETVKTTTLSTTDATVADIVAAFNGGLYTITGFKYAGVEYDATADAETVVAFPGASTIELVGTKSDRTPGTPVTSDESSIRLADDEKSGIRFKAGLAKADEVTFEAYGWFVTRKAFLEEAYPDTAIADIDYDDATTSVTFVEGWNYDPEGANSLTGEVVDEAVINSEDDDFVYFSAVLFGIPETMYEDVLVAVPVTVVDGTWMYGAPVEKSIYEVACDVAADEVAYAKLTQTQKDDLQDIIDTVEGK